jgi:hypothetical protein
MQKFLERALHLEVLDPSRQFYELRVPTFPAQTPAVDHA